MTRKKPHFPASVPKSAVAILMNRDLMIAMLRENPSQKAVAEQIGTTTEMMKRAREYHGIPARPANMPPPPSLEGMAPRDVLDDPDLHPILLMRAYSRARICPPFCRYWGQKTCPKPSDKDFDAPDEDMAPGAMHDLCPMAFYFGSDEPIPRNGDHPMHRVVFFGSPQGSDEQGREEVKPAENDRPKDTPDSFRQFLLEIKEG